MEGTSAPMAHVALLLSDRLQPLPPIPESAGPVDADDGRVEYVQAVRAYNKDEVYEKV